MYASVRKGAAAARGSLAVPTDASVRTSCLITSRRVRSPFSRMSEGQPTGSGYTCRAGPCAESSMKPLHTLEPSSAEELSLVDCTPLVLAMRGGAWGTCSRLNAGRLYRVRPVHVQQAGLHIDSCIERRALTSWRGPSTRPSRWRCSSAGAPSSFWPACAKCTPLASSTLAWTLLYSLVSMVAALGNNHVALGPACTSAGCVPVRSYHSF